MRASRILAILAVLGLAFLGMASAGGKPKPMFLRIGNVINIPTQMGADKPPNEAGAGTKFWWNWTLLDRTRNPNGTTAINSAGLGVYTDNTAAYFEQEIWTWPDGSTISFTGVGRLEMGEPKHRTITGGTGRYLGVYGRITRVMNCDAAFNCDNDNNVTLYLMERA